MKCEHCGQQFSIHQYWENANKHQRDSEYYLYRKKYGMLTEEEIARSDKYLAFFEDCKTVDAVQKRHNYLELKGFSYMEMIYPELP